MDFLYLLFGLVSFFASVIGAICGIGGGVLIKPSLDAFGVLSVASISFLSGCTVLSMSSYSVVKVMKMKESLIDRRTITPLAIGAAIGGVVGKSLFQMVSGLFSDKNMVGAVQAAGLLLITFGTLLYILKKERIRTRYTKHPIICVFIGLFLGIISSFLGIGGGPINLVVLSFFFSMNTKTAAQNSIYIILFSQLASLISTILTGGVPEFDFLLLCIMVVAGVIGGYWGQQVNQKINDKRVSHLFIFAMILIMLINVYNIYQFLLV